jgi:hypothetical protein
MKDALELRNLLENYSGCEQPLYNPLYPKMRYTDGVQAFAQNAGGGAYWFLDIVGTEYHPKQDKEDPFMCITLHVSPVKSAIISADDGNGNERVPPKIIEFTDCPAGIWKFFLEGDTLILPGEH